MRLFRNHPEIRFEGVIHENIWPALQRYMQARSSQVGYSNLVLDHEGYEGDQEAKHWRNLPLLLRALEADPARVYCWYHLGCIYRELGRLEEAQEALRRGIAVIRAKGWTEIQDSLCYIELIKLDLERDDRTVADLLDEARRLFPDHALLVWFEAQLRLREYRPEEAAQLFQWLLDRGEREPTGPDLGYDQRLFTSRPAAGLATCLFQQGRYAESRDWFQRAEAGAPDELEYRVKRHLCERLMAGAGLSA
jgi:tetratricopeptide (TPR) repeat protein